ncbi:MAG: non-heme iron oxygenase ferredoxin subunit [Planctomyces sp.]|nr:non-heme iron oxygenase ferredoxin subunit [Planctomyces sp.]
MSSWLLAAGPDEIPPGGRKSLIAGDFMVLLLRDERGYHAIEDVCTHDGQPLTDGEFSQGCIVCPRHGAKFDVATGEAKCMPATEPVRTFGVDVRNDGIYVQSDD